MTAPRSARTWASAAMPSWGDADQHGARIGGVAGPRHQAGVLEPADLGGHGRLGTVVQGGQVGDPRLALILDGGQQAGLGEGELHPDALVGQSVDPGDHGQEFRASRSASRGRGHAP